MTDRQEDGLRRLPLHDLHLELGARMVPFAGWEMPVQYPAGVMAEHLHCRSAAALFDVSHMGQVILRGPDPAAALEKLVPVDLVGLPEGRQRYAMFTAPDGGILDDLMVANRGDHLFLVVNAARHDADLAHMRAHLPDGTVEPVTDRALLAVQGPAAEAALDALLPGVTGMRFMDVATQPWHGAEIWLSRSGYTGEDGYEISVPVAHAEPFARALLARPGVMPAGLGARDSLRLESGLCLYGHDIDETTSPVEAGLSWAIQKVRRTDGARAGGFPGAERILRELAGGPQRRRVGLRPEGRAPVREGATLYAAEEDESPVGRVTSGGFGPSLSVPVAMGYLPTPLCAPGTRVYAEVRGRRLPALVAGLPFRPPGFKR